jgi:hypothetical protein
MPLPSQRKSEIPFSLLSVIVFWLRHVSYVFVSLIWEIGSDCQLVFATAALFLTFYLVGREKDVEKEEDQS